MTAIASKKALFLNVPDPGKAEKLASEAFNYGRSYTCPETFDYNYDAYGRMADVNSLRFGGNGSWASPCTNGTFQDVQERIKVENEVERLYIDFSMEPGFAYDAGGVGRDLQECRNGGFSCEGAFKSTPMPRHPQPSPLNTVPVQPMKSLSGYYNPYGMHYMYANRYSG
jgi:hypothetical protein